MGMIEFEDGAFEVDTRVIGEGLAVDPRAVPRLMREGRITSRCERGIAEDEGRYRLTFFGENRRFRLVVDAAGNVLQRSTIDFSGRPPPAAARR